MRTEFSVVRIKTSDLIRIREEAQKNDPKVSTPEMISMILREWLHLTSSIDSLASGRLQSAEE